MITPKVSVLEQRVSADVAAMLTGRASLSSMFPRSKTESPRVIMTPINDLYAGLSRHLVTPSFQFACFDSSYGRARELQEIVIAFFDNYSPVLPDGLLVSSIQRENIVGIDYDKVVDLFAATVEYRFFMTRG